MSIQIEKGEQFDVSSEVTQNNFELSKIMVGIGWNPSRQPKSFLSRFVDLTPKIDCDTTVIMLDEKESISDLNYLVYYGNLQDPTGSVVHMGDNLSGNGDGDNEQIFIDLNNIPQNVHQLLFVVNIYENHVRMQDFGSIENAYIRILDANSSKELLRYNLSEKYDGKTTLLAGKLYRSCGSWLFSALGYSTKDLTLKDFVRNYYSFS